MIDATTLAVAAFGAAGLTLSTTLPVVLARKTSRKTDAAVAAVHDEVRTNHGKRAGEYLEMVADTLRENEQTTKLVAHLAQAWSDHTVADAVSFEEINTRLARMERSMSRRRQGDGGTAGRKS